MKELINKTILITGGSGSLGRHLIKALLKKGAKRIISLSRDEGLIKESKEWVDSPDVDFRIGDITDRQSINRLLKNIDYVYHTAALKDVIIAEHYPREVLKINILGVLNLLDNSENVERFINISSDKAIGVVNCYGASKLFAEYLVKETGTIYKGIFVNVRCPNLLGSRGSVLDLWKMQLKKSGEISISDPNMTRFFITIPDAAHFIIERSLKPPTSDEVSYYPISYTKKFKLGDLAKAFLRVYGNRSVKIKIIGKRTGEKIHEDYATNVGLQNVEELVKLIKNIDL